MFLLHFCQNVKHWLGFDGVFKMGATLLAQIYRDSKMVAIFLVKISG